MKKKLYSDGDLISVVKKSISKGDVCRKLKLPYNGTSYAKIKQDIERLGLDISHFVKSGAEVNRKYPLIDKKCPVCKKIFKVGKGQPKEKITCSYACSNTYFRSGKDNPNWKKAKDLIRS